MTASDDVLLGQPTRSRAQRAAAGDDVAAVHARLEDPVRGVRLRSPLLLFSLITLTVLRGIGLWGNNIPNAWAFGIINFVWWIGIGHAGTFISAILLVLEQNWRTSINRFTEAMTLFAVMQAGLFPLLHLGRPWFAYWLFPYPSVMGTWPQVRSALPWDAAAVSTYFLVSLMFWYLGLVPDLAGAARPRTDAAAPDHLRHLRARLARLGPAVAPPQGRVHAARRHRDAARALGPQRSSASTSRSTGLPGWHSTIFPPFFVAGAIFSGFALVLTLIIPARRCVQARERDHASPLRTDGEDGADHRAGSRRTGTSSRSSWPGTPATSSRSISRSCSGRSGSTPGRSGR